MARILILLTLFAATGIKAQLRVFGEGMDRGKFILEDNGSYVMASEVEDQKTHGFKFLVFSRIKGKSVQAVQCKGEMPFAINDFIKNAAGNYVALGERYLEGNRESMLLVELNQDLTPIRATASYENGNEVEPYDILESGEEYLITGFTKTGQMISNGMVYITKEKQQMYLARYDCNLEQIASYIVGGFEEDVNPVGRCMIQHGRNLVIAGNVVGNLRTEIAVLQINLDTKKITWSTRLYQNGNMGVTDMLFRDGKIIIQCTMNDATQSDHGIIIMNTSGQIAQAWNLGEEGLQRSHCMIPFSGSELLLIGTSGKSRVESRRAAYVFSPATGKYSLNLQGNGIQSEPGRTTQAGNSFANTGVEFFPKTGVDTVLRLYTSETFGPPTQQAVKMTLAQKNAGLTLLDFPTSSGIFESQLFHHDVNYAPYTRWNVE